ncbi:hypothetical protein [Mycobacterium sp. NPDC050041]|uniref:hypothetical protein n=1 Tax=Mycobacterium sp. NPDC050041 TaxID=3364293 RepID=UPI003C304BAB
MSARAPVGIARYVGSVPRNPDDWAALMDAADVQLYRVDPPLTGHRVVAATQSMWAIRLRCVGEDGPDEDPVSTTIYGVTGGEGVRVDRDRPLAETADGKCPARALAELGYAIR